METPLPEVLVLYGGLGAEREISLRSGKAFYSALKNQGKYSIRLLDWKGESIVGLIDSKKSIVFPALHGTSGEDGTVQEMLENLGIHYAGADSVTSSLCIDKIATKKALFSLNIDLAKDLIWEEGNDYTWSEIQDCLGTPVIVKPNASGSSVGLAVLHSENDFIDFKNDLSLPFPLLLESYLPGLDLTVGVVSGCSYGVIGIKPSGGLYDYDHKYSIGNTVYQCPAIISDEIEKKIQIQAQEIVSYLGIRDFCRIDFKQNASGTPVFLEINTLPGLSETSLLPKSLACKGICFKELCLLLLKPVLERFMSVK